MYKLYWIKYPEHKDPKTEGYIGITSQSLEKRLKDHSYNTKNKHIRNRVNSGKCIILLLEDNLTQEQAKKIEEEYRPTQNIGWNLNKGGDLPPSRTGKVGIKTKLIGENRTEKQKLASKKHSLKMKGNNSSGKRKNKVIHKKICENCKVEFVFKDISKPRKYCSIKCSTQSRIKNKEYIEKVRANAKKLWQDNDYKMRVSESIRNARKNNNT